MPYIDQRYIKKGRQFFLHNDNFEFRGTAIKETEKAWLFKSQAGIFQWVPKAAIIQSDSIAFEGSVGLKAWFGKTDTKAEQDPETKYFRNAQTNAERFSGNWTD